MGNGDPAKRGDIFAVTSDITFKFLINTSKTLTFKDLTKADNVAWMWFNSNDTDAELVEVQSTKQTEASTIMTHKVPLRITYFVSK